MLSSHRITVVIHRYKRISEIEKNYDAGFCRHNAVDVIDIVTRSYGPSELIMRVDS